jgi:D-serine deaminase-like pyridoxal phosphate-dependent protein
VIQPQFVQNHSAHQSGTLSKSTDMNSFIGKHVETLPTPALVVDVEALDHNLKLMADYFATRRTKLRPHFKSHKSVTLAKRQLQAGNAVGMTCAKLAEAEVLVAGGIKDVLIANQVVGPEKAQRLAAMNRVATVRAAVDSPANVVELGAAAVSVGVTIGLLVEVDIGMRRCGVPAGEAVLALARKIQETRGLRFDGLQAYEGHLVTLPDFQERRHKVTEAMQPLLATREMLNEAAIRCAIVSGGGTGTYEITGNLPVFDELQAGSYALMDCSYKKICPVFKNALSILATVISAGNGCAVADVGLKGMGNEFGLPIVAGAPEAKARYVAEEHVPLDNLDAPVGSKVRLIPSHGCTTCNLHRRMWVVRRDIIEEVWPIKGSGCLE